MAYCLPPCGIQRLEVSQISLQLMRVRSLSREAKAAFEPGGTTNINVLSTQPVETAQERTQKARHCPGLSPRTGFVPITPSQSKVILPCLRSVPWDVPPQESLPCFSKAQGEVRLFSDIWCLKPGLMQGFSGESITLGRGNLESYSLSAWDCPDMWAIKNWPESLYTQKSIIQTQTNNSSIFLNTNLFILIFLQLIS